MYLPELSNIIQSKSTINNFGGVNKREDCQGNEFIDMKNMSSDSYPCIAPRKKRRISDFNWYSTNKISESDLGKNKLYLSCTYTGTPGLETVIVCLTKVINENCMDNEIIKFIIENYTNVYIKLGKKYYLIKRMDFTAINNKFFTGVLSMYFDRIHDTEIISNFRNNPPPDNLYNLYIKESGDNYIQLPCADKSRRLTGKTKMVFVNNRFYWLNNGCINYSFYLNNIKAKCIYHETRSGVSRLSIDDEASEKIKQWCLAYESVGEKLKITIDGYGTVECDSQLVSLGGITFLYQSLIVGNEYTLIVDENVNNATIGVLTNECDGDTDLIVGGNKIISIPSMYTYDTKYSTEERLSDKAEFCLDNGNSNNIRIERVVEDDKAVTWRFTVNTARSANFWKRTVLDKEKGKTIKKGYELNEYIHPTKESFIFFYYSCDGVTKEVPLPCKYKYLNSNMPTDITADIKVTEIAANKITFEMYLEKFNYIVKLPEQPTESVSELDYNLRQHFPQTSNSDENAEVTENIGTDEKTETTVRTVSQSFLGYEPSFDSIIGYVADGEMGELPFNIKFACASDNRLFACNQEGDRIFISAIGRIHDFVNEENGTMSADDIGVLSEGNFTGIVSFNHNVYFFKERCVHKLYGTYSEDWQLVEYQINGVQEGAERSIVVYDNFIIYKGVDAFYIFDGSVSTNISEKLGSMLDITSLKCCYASGFKNKYYVCCETTKDNTTVYTTYVYDVEKGLWHIEENNSETGFISMCSASRGILALKVETSEIADYLQAENIAGLVLEKGYDENDFLWSATTGDLLTDLPDNKYFTKLQLRLWVDKNSRLSIDIKYDNEEWERVGDDITATDKGSIVFPIIPRRCDHLALRFNGKGNAKIFSITETIEEASEI